MVVFHEDEEPHVGRASLVGNETLHVTLYTESMTGPWVPCEESKGNHMTVLVDKNTIKSECIFYLTSTGRLPTFMKQVLKNTYHEH